MGFSFLVWNVERFRATSDARIRNVADHIRDQRPDVFGILEFQGKDAARRLVTDFFGEYDFAMTDSKMKLEILVGYRRGKFAQVIYTQRREFFAGNLNLRPGGLLSLRQPNERAFYNLLFLHTDSGRDEADYRNRQEMFRKTWSLKHTLAGLPIQGGHARLIALGDLNTMGRSATATQPAISGAAEITALRQDAIANGMRVTDKSVDQTWSNPSGSRRSELDHVIASDDVALQRWVYDADPTNIFEIDVHGWNDRSGAARRSFIETISDHCSLWGEVV